MRSAFGVAALVAALCTSVFAPRAEAQNTAVGVFYGDRSFSGSITTTTCTSNSGTGCLCVGAPGAATLAITSTGTWTGTIGFKTLAADGATQLTVKAFPSGGGAGVTSFTGNGTWYLPIAGTNGACVVASSLSSGTAVINMQASGMPLFSQLLPGGEASGSLTAVGPSASGAALSGNPVRVAGSDGTNAVDLKVNSGGNAVVVGAGTAGTANNAPMTVQGIASMTPVQVAGTSADAAAISGSPVPVGFKAVADAAAPTQVTAGQAAYGLSTLERIPIFTDRHPNHVQCQVAVSTATTIQAVGGSCAAPGAGLSLYITDITFATNAAGIAADSFNTLKSGTGGTCGSGTAVVYQCFTTAATQATCEAHLKSPIKLTANNELCWINTSAGSKTLNIEGYIAP